MTGGLGRGQDCWPDRALIQEAAVAVTGVEPWRKHLSRQFGYRRHADQDRSAGELPRVIRWWWSARARSGCRSRSIWRSAATRVVVLDDADRIGDGSRAICFSKRSLEYWDRLGVGERMVEKGVVWKVGKIFLGTDMALPVRSAAGRRATRCRPSSTCSNITPRPFWSTACGELPRDRSALAQQGRRRWSSATTTPCSPSRRRTGAYRLNADYVVACDGARSALRGMVGAEFSGEVFEDQFLIADVKMTAEFPTERWFWFDPPFHSGQSALLHRQPDDVWRIDLQLGPRCRSRRRAAAGERAAAHRAHARPRQVRFRMDLALQIPVPPHGALRA